MDFVGTHTIVFFFGIMFGVAINLKSWRDAGYRSGYGDGFADGLKASLTGVELR